MRSERDFRRFAQARLRSYFPRLVSQGQLNPRIRALEPEWRALQRGLFGTLADPSEAYRVIDTSLVPAITRARARCGGLFAGQVSLGRCRSKTEWVYGFKVTLVMSPEGVVTAFFLASAACGERPIGEALIAHSRGTGAVGGSCRRRSSGLEVHVAP